MALYIGGTAVDATAAELNLLDGETGVNTGGNKKVFLQANAGTGASWSGGGLGGGTPYLTANGGSSFVTARWTTPSDFSSLTSCHMVLYYADSNGNAYLEITSGTFDGGDISATAQDSIAATTYAVADGQWTKSDVTAAVNGLTLSSGELFAIMVKRDDGHENDTALTNLWLSGFIIVYS